MKNTADEQQADLNDPAVATEEPIAPLELGSLTPEQFSELKDRAAKADDQSLKLQNEFYEKSKHPLETRP